MGSSRTYTSQKMTFAASAAPASFLAAVFLALGCHGACPTDWVTSEGSCYAFVDEYVTWATANQICTNLKSSLVEVTSQRENNFVKNQLDNRKWAAVWQGVQDFVREGTFVTASDLRPLNYSHWARGEPNNDHRGYEGGQDCVVVKRDGSWDDYQCDTTHSVAVACEKMSVGEEEIVG